MEPDIAVDSVIVSHAQGVFYKARGRWFYYDAGSLTGTV